MAFKLPSLSYAYDALEPHIDKKTMEIHHTKHHQAYVDNLNKALEGYEKYHDLSIRELIAGLNSLPDEIKTAVRNNGGGHLNHEMFWNTMSPNGGGNPVGKVAKRMKEDFGGFENFKSEFKKAALSRFGSGWAWLIKNEDGKLEITSTPNQDNPVSEGKNPLLGLDVWEHAYYLKYQNRRADYVDSWFNVVDWNKVEEKFNE